MKIKKMVTRITELSKVETGELQEHREHLKKTLRKLKHKTHDLKQKLSVTRNSKKRAELESKLKIVKAQRRKGIELLKELKTEKKSS